MQSNDVDDVAEANVFVEYIQIPVPVPLERRRGMRSVSDGPTTSFRINKADYLMMREEAEAVGISATTFIRWVTLFAARELRIRRTGENYEVHP